jgi:hypothetical protein
VVTQWFYCAGLIGRALAIFFGKSFLNAKNTAVTKPSSFFFAWKKTLLFIKLYSLRSPKFQDLDMTSPASCASTPKTLFYPDRLPTLPEDPADRKDLCEEIGSNRR